jgi:hypothetical protein
MVISLLGIGLLLVCLLDVFFTVLDANGVSVISSRLYRWMWWLWRHGARLLPPETRRRWLSVGAPLMIPAVIGVWMSLVVVGFAFVYFGGMSPDNFLFGGGSQPSLTAAFRLSWVTLSTIGFVEISPSSMTYSLTVALEAIVGGVLLTFTITYFLSVHRVVLSYNEFVTRLHHHAASISDPLSYVSGHFADGQPRALDSWLDQLHGAVVGLHEGLRRYPIVYYFQPRRRFRALPFAIETLTGLVAGLRWGLPTGHAVTTHPGIRTLVAALEMLVEDLEDRYVPPHERTVVQPVDVRTFSETLQGRRWDADRWVVRFADLISSVAAVTGVAARTDFADAYLRYREWLPFAVRTGDFVAAITRDLGYADDLRPGRSSALWQVWSRGPVDRPQPLTVQGRQP